MDKDFEKLEREVESLLDHFTFKEILNMNNLTEVSVLEFLYFHGLIKKIG